MVTTAAKAIDDALAAGVSPLLKRHGFRKLRRHYTLRTSTAELHVSAQASQWNHDRRASVTFNLGVVVPAIETLLTGLWEPVTNIGLGVQLLGQNLRGARPTHGDTALAVAVSAYNAGFSTDRPGDAKRTAAGAIVNQDSVNKVLSYMTDFEFADVASGAGSTAAPPAVTLDEIAPRAPSPTLPDIQRLPFEPVPNAQGNAFKGSWWLLLIGAALVAIAYLASRGR